jgi:hypothetical protein
MIANIERGQIPIVMDRPRVFFLTMLGAREFRRLTGMSLRAGSQRVFEAVQTDGDIDEELVVALFYAGLIHEDETLTPQAVASMVGFIDLAQLCLGLVALSMGDASAEGNAGAVTEEIPATGTTTGEPLPPTPTDPSG